MDKAFMSFEKVKELYPNEWVLLGNPEIKNTSVLGGIVLYHSKDKKEVCYIGRDKISGYTSVTISFAGDLQKMRKTGILRRI